MAQSTACVGDVRNLNAGREGLINHIVLAVQGLSHSIGLRSNNALQDTFRLLTLWFRYGTHDDASNVMTAGFKTVEVDALVPTLG